MLSSGEVDRLIIRLDEVGANIGLGYMKDALKKLYEIINELKKFLPEIYDR